MLFPHHQSRDRDGAESGLSTPLLADSEKKIEIEIVLKLILVGT